MLAILCLSCGLTSVDAQASQPFALDETRVVTFDAEAPALLTYEASGDEVVSITARTLNPATDNPAEHDLVLDVLAPDGARLAYNDDHQTARDDLAPTDAAIDKLILEQPGIYTIRVDTYGGIFPGEAEVTFSAADLHDAIIERSDDGNTFIEALLPAGTRYSYTFEAAEGDTLTFTARDTSNSLDPRLLLVDAATGDVLTSNDDHNSADPALDLLDARMSVFVVPATGRYTVIVTDFLGKAGHFVLTLEFDGLVRESS